MRRSARILGLPAAGLATEAAQRSSVLSRPFTAAPPRDPDGVGAPTSDVAAPPRKRPRGRPRTTGGAVGSSPIAHEDGGSGDPAGAGTGTAPPDWERVLAGIREMRAARTAPVDTMGTEAFLDPALPPAVARFHVLVAAMLSSQTKDQVTAGAMQRLKAHGLTVEGVLRTPQATLAELLRPVGFFNNKVRARGRCLSHDHAEWARRGTYSRPARCCSTASAATSLPPSRSCSSCPASAPRWRTSS